MQDYIEAGKEYINAINRCYQIGNDTEHTYRPDLQNFLKKIVPSNISITNEPKRIKCGMPDYVFTKEAIPVGYIEAKQLKTSLETFKKEEQFHRYVNGLNKVAFTNYLDFEFYDDGRSVEKVTLGVIKNNLIKPQEKEFEKFVNLVNSFTPIPPCSIKKPDQLAKLMASKTKLLTSAVKSALYDFEDIQKNDPTASSDLMAQMNALRISLMPNIDIEKFADLYSQTIAYSMFTARFQDSNLESFSSEKAANLIPHYTPFLRKFFHHHAVHDVSHEIKWIIDALADLFRATDIKTLVREINNNNTKIDPTTYFYETFLKEYDPQLKIDKGVWYTPEPVVNFIVRGVDHILKTEFNLKDGFADSRKTKIKINDTEKEIHKVQILDPATGTGTFLQNTIKHIHQRFVDNNQQGMWQSYVKDHLLPRLNGFEILIAPYAIAHLKINILLDETGYKNQNNERLNIYLVDALEQERDIKQGDLFQTWLYEEAKYANHIKQNVPVMCILGNPPYKGESENKSKWIMELMEDYKKEPDSEDKLKERNPKWINDDYVKFIRSGQYYIEKNGEGILAFVCPHGFLDNPTFRGMRYNLLKTYDKIFTIDLHGNAKKKEVLPDGSEDKNIFDIQQGVCITFFVKTGKKANKALATVHHYDLFGKREIKYDFLNDNNLESIPFVKLLPTSPQYFIVQKDFDTQAEYDKGFSINSFMSLNSVGIVTARDHFSIHFQEQKVQETISNFLSFDDEKARDYFNLGKDVRDWKIKYARSDIQKNQGKIVPISYRPFDTRYTYYTGKSKGFHCYPRNDVMQHFIMGDNLGLSVGRQGQAVGSMPWNVLFIINNIDDLNIFYRGGGNTYPLYLYPNKNPEKQFLDLQEPKRVPNFNREILKQFVENLKLKFIEDHEDDAEYPHLTSPKGGGNNIDASFTDKELDNKEKTTIPPPLGEVRWGFKSTINPLDILDYIYAVLHSPTYRETYKEFLKIDFPKVPYPSDVKKFWQLVHLGREVRMYHLLEHENFSSKNCQTSYPISGDNLITKIEFKPNDNGIDGKVMINKTQYFDNVPLIAWEFYIGGYQPAQKWLKDRKNRQLSYDDIIHYQKIITSLSETNRLMQEIDKIDF